MKDNILVADMHTHSLFSHDSTCSIEEMCQSQIQKGTNIFAVCDHCDIFAYDKYDIYTPIKNAFNQVKLLNKKYKDRCIILAGVEIGEGFWFPEEVQKVHDLLPYDVVLGSVHSVKCTGLSIPYSTIDFTRLDPDKIYEYLDCYFKDILTMLKTTDFDILTHLTCPVRYIKGKYGICVDLERFDKQIEKIFKIIIGKNIALEINTSSYGVLNDFMPGRKLIKRYFDMGGRLVTLGSDAHISENASVDFEFAIKYLKEIGFENICYFKNRKINKIKI